MDYLKRKEPSKSTLNVEAPKSGELIVYNEEEQRSVDEEVQRRLEYFRRDVGDRVFPKGVIDTLSNGFATDALRNVVLRKISESDFEGAASTCMKLLGIAIERSADWLLLAKIFALYGDIEGAKHFIKVAKNERTKYGETKDSKNYWKKAINDVLDIIDSKRNI